MSEALLQLGRLREASEYAEAVNRLLPPHSELKQQVDDIKQRVASGEYIHDNIINYYFVT
jgi:WD and tetratricopeptide repeat-containing protein 1